MSLLNRPKAASLTPLTADAASSLAHRLEARTIRPEWGSHLRVFPAGGGLTAAERREIASATAALDEMERERCSPDRSEVIEWAADMLTSNFKAQRRFRREEDQKADDARVFDGFLIALDGRPAAAVTAAVRAIINDETDLSRTFVPTATEVAHVVKRITSDWSSHRYRLEQLLRLEEAKPEPPAVKMTGPERAALDERIARLKRSMSVQPWGSGREAPE